jgi:hypothetical protein
LCVFLITVTLPVTYFTIPTLIIVKNYVRWAGHVECVWGEEEFVQGFGGKARRKEAIGKPQT